MHPNYTTAQLHGLCPATTSGCTYTPAMHAAHARLVAHGWYCVGATSLPNGTGWHPLYMLHHPTTWVEVYLLPNGTLVNAL